MKLKGTIHTFFQVFIVLAGVLTTILMYPKMPALMASHWDINGEVNGYMPKAIALGLFPAISLIMIGLLKFLPKTDPHKENLKKFQGEFDLFIVVLLGFLYYIYALTIFWNLGIKFDMGQLLSPAFAVLFFVIGILISSAKRNYFIGVRTPWTLSSEVVWDKTHKFSGKLFKIIGLIGLIGLIIPSFSLPAVIGGALIAGIGSVIYSYLEYRKNQER
jgi:uncharacterized membrane protein